MRGGIPKIAWVGLGLLAIVGGMLSFGERETKTFPATDSFSPSGTSALAELLRKQGYPVRVDQSSRPELDPKQLVICFVQPPEASLFGAATPPPTEINDPFTLHLQSFLQSGGKALILPIEADFARTSLTAIKDPPIMVTSISGAEKYSISAGTGYISMPDEMVLMFQESDEASSLWQSARGDESGYGYRSGKGTAFVLGNGLVATNRFLDRNQNAEFVMRQIESLDPEKAPIVFTEASFGNVQERGVLETIGAWANAAWQQLLLLGLIIAITLGQRLGLPDEERGKLRNSRELVDAVGESMSRARSGQMAMVIALQRLDTELRIALKLPKQTSRIARDELLPASLRKTLANLEAASTDTETPTWDAVRKIQRAEKEVNEFLGYRARRRRRATIKT